ncbi:MAG: phosphoribosylformylglycinamidine synthase subunit PurQ [Deltaproteobacteria bacterium]|nr:phosphoribosylformylglycinamidine synthase subunit PurQ [Deltaproteobacteria bacterium]
MNIAICVFPGSNCERDCFHAAASVPGYRPCYVWHREERLPAADAVILPGGFSYGDYLRTGAIARQSPIIQAVIDFAAAGGPVLGICNGFQILTEAGLLPGALLRNASLQFECRTVHLRVEQSDTPFTCAYPVGAIACMPTAHMDGNYYVDDAALRQLEADHQIVFRYCTAAGEVTPAANPNGARANIAGVCNVRRNVVGLMPHPERCSEALVGGTDGLGVFTSIGQWLRTRS